MVAKLTRRVPYGHLPAGDIPDLLTHVFRCRGINAAEEIDTSLSGLLPPDTLSGIGPAAALLVTAVVNGELILVIGDYDADGATSTALMVSVIRQMGGQVDYLVPNRFEFGYGLTEEIVAVGARFKPSIILTVDNGISSLEGVLAANALGIKVVITDHHLPGEELPQAAAIVNPNQPGCQFPSKNIAGVGVAFYLLSVVRRQLAETGWFERRGAPVMADYLDLVALGTVADVVNLDTNNRILVQGGLRRIRANRTRPGVLALIEAAGSDVSRLNAGHLGFQLGPRLNAAGRLEEMSIGVECLLSTDLDDARQLAGRLNQLNIDRRVIETEMRTQAESIVRAELASANSTEMPCGLCLFHEQWHHGVVGIVASRLKDEFHRPVITFAPDDKGQLRGSARTIPGFHIRDALATIAAKYPGMFSRFGGHAMAAGMTLSPEKLEVFRQAFVDECEISLKKADLEPVVVSDGEIIATVDLALVAQLQLLVPFGSGFPEPLFDGEFTVVTQRIVGTGHLKLKLKSALTGQIFDAIAFGQDQELKHKMTRLAYHLDINEYNGRRSIQLRVAALELKSPA